MYAAQLLGQTEAVEWPKLLSGRSTGQQSEATSQESNQNKQITNNSPTNQYYGKDTLKS